MKRTISVLLCLVMLLGILPVSASAVEYITTVDVLAPGRMGSMYCPIEGEPIWQSVVADTSNSTNADYWHISSAQSSKFTIKNAFWEVYYNGEWRPASEACSLAGKDLEFTSTRSFRLLVSFKPTSAYQFGNVNVSCELSSSVEVLYKDGGLLTILAYFDQPIHPYGAYASNPYHDFVMIDATTNVKPGTKIGDYLNTIKLDQVDLDYLYVWLKRIEKTDGTVCSETDTFETGTSYVLGYGLHVIDLKTARFVENPELWLGSGVYYASYWQQDYVSYKVPITVTVLDKGAYTVNLVPDEAADVYAGASDSESAEALDNTLAAFKEDYADSYPYIDLDDDGEWDVYPYTSGGTLYWDKNADTNFGGVFTYTLPKAKMMSLVSSGDFFFSELKIRFPGKDLGSTYVDLRSGKGLVTQQIFAGFLGMALGGQISSADGGVDLDVDGFGDFKFTSDSSGIYAELLPNTKIQGKYTVVFPENIKNAWRDTAENYYGIVEFYFPGGAWTNPFTDVKSSDWFYEPVLWAVNAVPQITAGTSETTFSPNKNCTRGQIVTFLWRSQGCPEPTSKTNPFTDVKTEDYFFKAVLWAVEKNVTSGKTATTFAPKENCTRAQAVTFLWRTAGEPEPTSMNNPFTDVGSKQYYYKAVLWAVEMDITKGTSATKFSPNAFCTRGQIVTFLFRAFGPKG